MENSSNEKYNYGLALAKILFCFVVILCHFWIVGTDNKYLIVFRVLKPVAVPIFMLISFYLMKDFFIKNDNNKLFKRVITLFIPVIFYAIVYYLVYKYSCIYLNTCSGYVLTRKNLLLQIFTGHVYNQTMWFQTVLITLTILFFIIFKVFKNNKGCIALILLLLGAAYLQVSGLNYKMFGEMSYETRYPLGRIVESIPYAIVGFIIAYVSLFDRIIFVFKKRVIPIIFLLITSVVFIIMREKNTIIPSNGFGYQGILLFLIGTTLFMMFGLLKFKNDAIKKIIKKLSSYTLGVYCMHRLVAFGITQLFIRLNYDINTFCFCVVVYITCNVISFLVSLLPFKFIKNII